MQLANKSLVIATITAIYLIYLISPVNAFAAVSCSTKKEGSGAGSVFADCDSSPQPKVGLWASDTTVGSHAATGILKDEFSVGTTGSYRIYVKGKADGRLGILGVPGTNFLGARSDINVYIKLYKKETSESVPGGEETQIYSKVAQDYYWDTIYNDVFEKYLVVDLDVNKRYIMELRAVASDKALGPVTVVSDWGAKPPSLNNYGILWLKDTIELIKPSPTPCPTLNEIIQLINGWQQGSVPLERVIDAINKWASPKCSSSSGASSQAKEQQKAQLMSMIQNPSNKCRPEGSQCTLDSQCCSGWCKSYQCTLKN